MIIENVLLQIHVSKCSSKTSSKIELTSTVVHHISLQKSRILKQNIRDHVAALFSKIKRLHFVDI